MAVASFNSLAIRTRGLCVLVPTAPSWASAATPAACSGAVVLSLTAAASADALYALYRLNSTGTAWSAESASFSRTGTGDITVDGLSNGSQYQFTAYAKAPGGVCSALIEPRTCTPAASSSTEPDGPVSLVLENFETLLANAPAFQTFCGAGSAECARECIFKTVVDDAEDDESAARARGYAYIWDHGDQGWTSTRAAGGTRGWFLDRGTLGMELVKDIPSSPVDLTTDGTKRLAHTWFTNLVGNILADMKKLSGSGTYLVVREIEVDRPAGRPPADEEGTLGKHYRAGHRVHWGFGA